MEFESFHCCSVLVLEVATSIACNSRRFAPTPCAMVPIIFPDESAIRLDYKEDIGRREYSAGTGFRTVFDGEASENATV